MLIKFVSKYAYCSLQYRTQSFWNAVSEPTPYVSLEQAGPFPHALKKHPLSRISHSSETINQIKLGDSLIDPRSYHHIDLW